MSKTFISGFLWIHSEQGVAGCWAFLSTAPRPSVYDGLHILQDGDHLTIRSKEDPSRILWSGSIKLSREGGIYDKWINADEAGIDRAVWWKWFRAEYPAELVIADVKKPR
ncbi:MAG TPA: hypothetical protein VNG29_03145 [Candidatus Paceibacterota bacterium]|nr:hypothetical protein [Candidatus Paceibacterota bacterium]